MLLEKERLQTYFYILWWGLS